MKDACDIAVWINHTYMQPVVSKSPSTNLASIVDVDDLTDKLIEQGIRTSLYDLYRNTQTTIIDTLLFRHNPRHKKGGFMCFARNC